MTISGLPCRPPAAGGGSCVTSPVTISIPLRCVSRSPCGPAIPLRMKNRRPAFHMNGRWKPAYAPDKRNRP
ncbi:hypothetical protein ALMP_10220 [Streptomyces sp. A012304]|nr:hypothetical protein ALMP_10220 [Streptomyces sp. A012304]